MTTRQRSGWNAAAGAAVLLVAAVAGNVAAQRQHQNGETMSIEHNKAAALRWSDELWSQGNLAVTDEIVAPDYVRHDPGDPFPARAPEDVKRIVSMLRAMLPDFHITVDAVIAEGDMVVSRYTADGDEHGRLHGHAGDGKPGADTGDPNVPLLERQDRRKLGSARRSGYSATVGAPHLAGNAHQPLTIAHMRRIVLSMCRTGAGG
jgi:hypothetical protein